jgi:streptogramin lyase
MTNAKRRNDQRMTNSQTPNLRFEIGCLVIGAVVLLGGAARAGETRTLAGTGAAGYSPQGTLAVEAKLNNPFGVVRGPDGAIYFCDTANHAVRRIDPASGKVLTVAGSGRKGYSGDGGPAVKAELNEPYEVRFDRDGNLFFVERLNHLVRRVDAKTGAISTVAGDGKAGFGGDGGPAVQAQMREPHSLAFGPDGSLYVCDIGNHRIRRIDPEKGTIETFAGTGQRGKTAEGARLTERPALNGPRAVDFDARGDMWLALREGNAVYRIDMKSGVIHHVAGTGAKGFTGNDGPAKQATLSGPKGIAVHPRTGDVYLADTESHSIRMIEIKTGMMRLVAGTGEKGDGPDGEALGCRLARPHGVFVDADGAVYVGDSENHRVRVIR